HLFVDRLCDGEETVDVCVDHFIPCSVSGRSEVVAAIDGGIVHENIDSAPFLNEFARDLLHPNPINNRHLGVKSLATESFDLLAHLRRQIITRTIVERHISTLTCEDLAECRTDSTRSTSDERSLSFQQQTHVT